MPTFQLLMIGSSWISSSIFPSRCRYLGGDNSMDLEFALLWSNASNRRILKLMMSFNRPVLNTLSFVLALSIAPTILPALTITDGVFLNTDWLVSAYSVNGGGGAAFVEATGGNPDEFQRFDLTVANAPPSQRSVIAVALFRTGLIYDPAALGAPTSMDISLDLRRTAAGSGAVIWGLALRQAGETYVSDAAYAHTTTWTTIDQTGIVADNFARLDSTDLGNGLDELGKPDLSITGAPFEIGFFTRNSTALGTSGYSRSYGIDNLEITIIPEPSTTAAFISLAALATAFAPRRRRQ